jgi:hypothetical protein
MQIYSENCLFGSLCRLVLGIGEYSPRCPLYQSQMVLDTGDSMNPFTEHPHRQGLSYVEHLVFALGIAWRLFNSVIAFSLHALFPFISIKRELDLEETTKYMRECNDWLEIKKLQKPVDSVRGTTFNDTAITDDQPARYSS